MNYFKITDDAKTKTSELLAQCKAKFPVYSYWNDRELDKQFPPPPSPTTRYFKKNVEADENLKDMSADDLDEKKIKGITLRERLLMELQYFAETGKHLDIENITLCSGSRRSDGSVPGAYWDVDGFRVCWDYRGSRNPNLRAREAVTLNPLPSITYKVAERMDIGDMAILDGDCVRKASRFLISGTGRIVETATISGKSQRRAAFLGSYGTREGAERARDEVQARYGTPRS